MTNLEKYNQIFVEVFNVSVENLNSDFNKDSVSNWDSIHQLSLFSSIEEAFDVMFDSEDIIGLTSYDIGMEILMKYNVEL